MNTAANERISNILYGTVNGAHYLSLAQRRNEEAHSSATALTGVGLEVLLLREGTSIDILVAESGQREEIK